MFIIGFYLATIFYTIILMYLFPVGWFDYQVVSWYFYLVLSLILAYILSFISTLIFIKIVGHFRRKKPITNAFNHAFAKSLLRLGLHLLRTKVILSGEENIPKGKFVLVSNHQENYDILVIMTAFKNHPLSFVAKEVLGKLPIFGKWMQILGNVFISRDADRQAAMAMIQAIKNYNQGLCMAIFPEGKRSFFNQMLPFKPGAFKLAMKPKADIVIATQYNTCTILKKIPWKPYKVYLHIHEVIPYEFYKNMTSHELSEFVKQKIQKQIDIFDKQLQ